MITHAARMRIVLAQRTRDRTQWTVLDQCWNGSEIADPSVDSSMSRRNWVRERSFG